MELTILSSGTNATTFTVGEARGSKIPQDLRLGTEMAHFFCTETLFSAVKL